ncbi:Plasmid stabilization system protein ParE [Aquiflexum balticum DSM 16537]|uniref:Plasmid stabilization system protein ParE n=1 Tax=Aquiflexum balticum DSM 16537 TaxID=758820 RepID=A0A1W2H5N1_9BACT|nr:type II toxin-antitoxin system RelE/ParE family toxin [Aquiflexum balticum]SMD44074.1 Plasmid stabilization system protein ParE [Aquiflexum balticum DSM 16537]
MERKIIWEDHAIELFIKAIEWISKDSVFQAEKVEKAILEKIEELPNYPEKYPPDKFKLQNPGLFRAFETHSYRVSYKFNDQEIRILRIRHVRQSPKAY